MDTRCIGNVWALNMNCTRTRVTLACNGVNVWFYSFDFSASSAWNSLPCSAFYTKTCTLFLCFLLLIHLRKAWMLLRVSPSKRYIEY